MSDPTDSTESDEPTEAVDEASGDDAGAKPAKKAPAKKAAAEKTAAKKSAAKKTAGAASTKVAEKKPAKKGADKKAGKKGKDDAPRSRRLRRQHQDDDFLNPVGGPVLTVRSVLALVLALGGIAWMAYYYLGVRADPTKFPVPDTTGWGLMGDLGEWNYAIGFAAIMLGLIVAAHPSTPLGRGRGVVVGMLSCFVIGLVWICTFYVISGADYFYKVPVFNDLEQKNLIVGIAFMALGFTYATKWE